VTIIKTGVCDGNDASGVLGMSMDATLTATYTDADLSSPSSDARQSLDPAFAASLAGSLGRPSDKVRVDGMEVRARRALAGALARSNGRALTAGTTVAVDSSLLPYGGPNNVPAAVLERSLTGSGATTSSLFAITGVSSADPEPFCGNGICEAGERFNPAAPADTDCPADCPYPVLSCPAVAGAVCNGVGACVASSAGGVCQCRSLAGYGGDACDVCLSGFSKQTAANGVVTCVRFESQTRSSASPAPAVSVLPSDDGGSLLGAGEISAIVILGGIFVVAAVVVVIVSVRAHKKAKKHNKITKLEVMERGSTPPGPNPGARSPKYASSAVRPVDTDARR
jgi:hypothetical protein